MNRNDDITLDMTLVVIMDHILNNHSFAISKSITNNYRMLVIRNAPGAVLFRWEGDDPIGDIYNYGDVIPLVKKHWPNRKLLGLSNSYRKRLINDEGSAGKAADQAGETPS